MSYERVNWTNTIQTPLNAQNLNNMDIGIKNTYTEINNVMELAAYPNLGADCISGTYAASNGAELFVGEGNVITVTQNNASTTVVSSSLNEAKAVDDDRLMLVKLRVKTTKTGNDKYMTVEFKYLTETDEIYVLSSDIIVGNLNTSGVGNPSYVITDNEYHNIWCIFKLPEETEITGIAVKIGPYAKAKISAFEAFYSSDRASGNIGNLFEVINTVYDVDNTTQASQVFDVTEDS